MSPYRVRSDAQRFFEELCPYLFVAFLIYMAAHGLGLVNAGLNVDDWNQVEVPPAWGNQGRWALALYYHYVLLSNFTESFQVVGAFVLFVLIAYVIARQIAGPKPFLLFAAIFALGVSHPYWVDALNFSPQVTSSPLAFLIALLAFRLALLRTTRATCRLLFVACGGVLLCISLSLYQPYGFFGLLVPGISLMSIASVDNKRLFAILAMSLAILLLGCGLYVALYHLYFQLHPEATEDARAGYSGLSDVWEKLQIFPALFRQALGAELFNGSTFSALQRALLALGAIVTGINVVWLLHKRDWLAALRLPLGFAGLMLTPFFAWFAIKAGYPPRAMAPISFALAAAVFSLPLEPISAFGRRLGMTRPAIPAIVLSLSALAAVAGVIVSSAAWYRQFLAHERDKALAGLIAATYVSLAKPGDTLVLVGSRDYPGLHLGDSVGRSASDPVWSRPDVLKRLFDNPYFSPRLVETSAFDHACTEYPQPGSVVRTDGAINICLAAAPGRP